MTLRKGVSLKDIVKLERLTEDLFSRYFPEGKRQVNTEIEGLVKLFQYKYSRKQIWEVFSYAVCHCCLAEYVSLTEEEIVSAITRIPGNALSGYEVRQMYAFVLNHQVSQISDSERKCAKNFISRVARGL